MVHSVLPSTHLPHHLIKLLPTQNQPHLRHQHHQKPHGEGELNRHNLRIQSHQPQPRPPPKRLPRIEHPHHALPTFTLRDNFPTKGTVEGNDGFILFGKGAGLDAQERDLCGEDDEKHHAKGDGEDEPEEFHDGALLVDARFPEHLWVPQVRLEADAGSQGLGEVDCDFLRGGPDGLGEDDFPGGLAGCEAAVPRLIGGEGDDVVGPGGGEADADDGGGDGGEGMDEGALRVPGDEDIHERKEEVVGEHVGEELAETAVVGPATGDGAEVFERGADVAGDGFVLDESEVFGNGGIFFGIFVEKRAAG